MSVFEIDHFLDWLLPEEEGPSCLVLCLETVRRELELMSPSKTLEMGWTLCLHLAAEFTGWREQPVLPIGKIINSALDLAWALPRTDASYLVPWTR